MKGLKMNSIIKVIDCHVVYWEGDIPLFLTIKRSPNERYPRVWQCVTGGVRTNEKAYHAAQREVKEETNLNISKMWTIDIINNYYDPKYNQIFQIPVFGAEVTKNNVELSSEHVDFYWGDLESVKKKILWNQQKLGLVAFHEMLISKTKKLELSEIII